MLASRGARVVVDDVLDPSEVVESIRAAGGEAIGAQHDISNEEGARDLVADAVAAFGRLDAVVNNAGVAGLVPFEEMTWEVFDRTMRVHVYGSYFVTRHAWPHLAEHSQGRVVITSSKATLWADTPNLSQYGSAKGAMLGMTRQLALEGSRHGIGVNAVFPTAMTSVRHPRAGELAGQLGRDADDLEGLAAHSSSLVAAVVTWLCHPDCQANGEFFKAQAGAVRRVSFVLSQGINDPALTPEQVRDRFPEVMAWGAASLLDPFPAAGSV